MDESTLLLIDSAQFVFVFDLIWRNPSLFLGEINEEVDAVDAEAIDADAIDSDDIDAEIFGFLSRLRKPKRC